MDTQKKTILHLDNDTSFLDVMASVIEDKCHTVISVCDVNTARVLLKENRISMIISDFNLSATETSTAFLKEANAQYPEIPIAILSGTERKDIMEDMRQHDLEPSMIKGIVAKGVGGTQRIMETIRENLPSNERS